MDLHIELADRKNLSVDIYRQVRQAVTDGRLRQGGALPSTRRLARQLGISRTTVIVAYDRLMSEGLVTSRIGAGVFVSEHAVGAAPVGRETGSGALQARAIWGDVPLPTTFNQPARFDFRTGLPSHTLFPHETWRRLVRRALDPNLAVAGVYLEPGGYRPLREAIAWQVGASRGVSTAAEDVTITNGAQQALDLVVRTMLEPGDRIAVEDPGYRLPRRLFESLGLKVVPVPVDEEGLTTEALGPEVRAVYVTPSHQFPLGMTMSLARRRSLLAWADRSNGLIIEDDYDGEFRFAGAPISALKTLDPHGRVAYVGSFSKVMLPTLRLGFVVTPPQLTRPLQAAKYVSDWHTALVAQHALAAFIEEGEFARHVRRASKAYLKRHDLVASILRRDFRDILEVMPSKAGMHLAARGGPGFPADREVLVRSAHDQGVAFHPLSMFSEAPMAGIAIGFGAIELEDIPRGLKLLRTCFHRG